MVVPLLGLNCITSLPTPWSFNNVHIFRDSTAAINAIISPTQQDLNSNIIQEIKYFSSSTSPVTIFATYSPAHIGIVHSEEANRLAKIGAKYAKKLKKGKIINIATVKSKAKSLSLETWATRWERQAGTRYQY